MVFEFVCLWMLSVGIHCVCVYICMYIFSHAFYLFCFFFPLSSVLLLFVSVFCFAMVCLSFYWFICLLKKERRCGVGWVGGREALVGYEAMVSMIRT